MNMSFMGGLSATQMLSLVMNTLYERFVKKDVEKFDGFHDGILDTFNTINMALPGKHYVAPPYEDVKELFEKWKEANKEEKKEIFSKFIKKNVNLNKVDESTMITALVAPPAAMVAKKTGQRVPQLAFMNAIPDVVFVPSATILALIAIKVLRLMFMGKTTSKDATETQMEETTKQEPQTITAPIEQEPQTTTAPTEQEPQTTPSSIVAQEPQTKPPSPIIEHEPQTTPSPIIDHEPQPTTAPAPTIEEPQTAPEPAIEPHPQIATVDDHPPTTSHPRQHDHKDKKGKTFCALCNKFH